MAKASLGGGVIDLRGTVGGEVFVRGRGGAVVRRKPVYRRPTTATQAEVQSRMSAVMAAWNTLSHAQAMDWNRYAATLTRDNPVSGERYHPTGQNTFVALASKFLQVNPTGTVPLTPPTSTFADDSLTVTATGGTGQIVFTASGPNHAPAVTELLVQKLKSARRSPTAFYKSAAFVNFTAGSLSHAVAVPAGWYATATRFVNASTGQMTALLTLGVVEVV